MRAIAYLHRNGASIFPRGFEAPGLDCLDGNGVEDIRGFTAQDGYVLDAAVSINGELHFHFSFDLVFGGVRGIPGRYPLDDFRVLTGGGFALGRHTAVGGEGIDGQARRSQRQGGQGKEAAYLPGMTTIVVLSWGNDGFR